MKLNELIKSVAYKKAWTVASCYFRKNEGEVSEIFSVAGMFTSSRESTLPFRLCFFRCGGEPWILYHFIFNMNFRLPCRRHRILEILFTSHFDYYRVKGQFFYRSSKKKSSKYRNGIFKIKINISQVITNKIFEFVVKTVYKIRSENCLVRKSIRLTTFGTESTTNYAVKLCHAIPPENQTCFFSHGL